MQKSVLVLIDLQVCFEAAVDAKYLKKCISFIKKARRNNQLVLVVTYKTWGSSPSHVHTKIVKALQGYDNIKYVQKGQNDGSSEIIYALKTAGYDLKRRTILNIGGVNTHACVLDTVCGLAQYRHKFVLAVHSKACNDEYAGMQSASSVRRYFREYTRSKKVVIK